METCETCKFFRTNNKRIETEAISGPIRGNCKRFPPAIVPDKVVVHNEMGGWKILNSFSNAVVKIDDWCGEYVNK